MKPPPVRQPAVWPWVVGLLVLAILVWALVELFATDDEAAPPPVDISMSSSWRQPASELPRAGYIVARIS